MAVSAAARARSIAQAARNNAKKMKQGGRTKKGGRAIGKLSAADRGDTAAAGRNARGAALGGKGSGVRVYGKGASSKGVAGGG